MLVRRFKESETPSGDGKSARADDPGRIEEIAIIPAIRVSSSGDAHFAAEAVTKAGIPIVEITMTVPGAIDLMPISFGIMRG